MCEQYLTTQHTRWFQRIDSNQTLNIQSTYVHKAQCGVIRRCKSTGVRISTTQEPQVSNLLGTNYPKSPTAGTGVLGSHNRRNISAFGEADNHPQQTFELHLLQSFSTAMASLPRTKKKKVSNHMPLEPVPESGRHSTVLYFNTIFLSLSADGVRAKLIKVHY